MSVHAARDALFASLATLAQRRDTTPDEAEKEEIAIAMLEVQSAIRDLALADLLASAKAVSDAAEALEGAVRAAKRKPFDIYLERLQRHIAALDEARGAMHEGDALPPAPEQDAEPLTAAAARSFRGAAEPKLSTATDFAALKAEYARLFEACEVLPERKANIDYYVRQLERNRDAYTAVQAQSGVPWLFTGILHGMECGFSFQRHLHNGDPLAARTVRVPAGHPRAGEPPFPWLVSAIDAVQLKRLHEETDWSVPRQLFHFERFNGFGYRRRGIPSPYLWSFSKHYRKGKFVADGVFDPEAVSKQSGAGVILKAAQARGLG
jgi:lysozyme family protein